MRLVVAVKRKLQFYYWKNRKFLELQPDINLPDVPRTLAWRKDAICIGYGSAYSLVKMGWMNLQPFMNCSFLNRIPVENAWSIWKNIGRLMPTYAGTL